MVKIAHGMFKKPQQPPQDVICNDEALAWVSGVGATNIQITGGSATAMIMNINCHRVYSVPECHAAAFIALKGSCIKILSY